jgi:hypothetical protein
MYVAWNDAICNCAENALQWKWLPMHTNAQNVAYVHRKDLCAKTLYKNLFKFVIRISKRIDCFKSLY